MYFIGDSGEVDQWQPHPGTYLQFWGQVNSQNNLEGTLSCSCIFQEATAVGENPSRYSENIQTKAAQYIEKSTVLTNPPWKIDQHEEKDTVTE